MRIDKKKLLKIKILKCKNENFLQKQIFCLILKKFFIIVDIE